VSRDPLPPQAAATEPPTHAASREFSAPGVRFCSFPETHRLREDIFMIRCAHLIAPRNRIQKRALAFLSRLAMVSAALLLTGISRYAAADHRCRRPSSQGPAGQIEHLPLRADGSALARTGAVAQRGPSAQDLQFHPMPRTIRIRNRPAKQVGNQRWLNQHSMNRGSTRQSVLCAVSASPECLMNRGELHRLRTGSPAHCPRPSGSASTLFSS
jgi:hypothetical protein